MPPESFDLADLQVPRPPGGVPYPQVEDRHAELMLEANGFGDDPEALRRALDTGIGVIAAAAARVAGIRGDDALLDVLEEANLGLHEETVAVQVGYALARNGRDAGRDLLARQLEVDPATSPAPLQAAGSLARLGDPRGWPVVLDSLRSGDRIAAMVACKQLFAFRGLEGVDVDAGYAAALARSEEAVVNEARLQLRGA